MALFFGTPTMSVFSIASLVRRPQGRIWAGLALLVCAINIALILDMKGVPVFGEPFWLTAQIGSCAVN